MYRSSLLGLRRVNLLITERGRGGERMGDRVAQGSGLGVGV